MPGVLVRRVHWGSSLLVWLVVGLFLGPFMLLPGWRVMHGALSSQGHLDPSLLLLPWRNGFVRESVRNSLVLALAVTLLSSLIGLPLAYVAARLSFRGKSLLTSLLLVPLLLPPLVGALGLRQLLSREGLVNTLLLRLGVCRTPVDFLTLALPMVALVAALHLYPLIYLNAAAAWANVDPSLEEASASLGAAPVSGFRRVTLPLLMPGYLAGALIVFVFALTDLGTPLIFDFNQVAAVQIFNAREDPADPMGYVLGLWVTLLAVAVFWFSRRYLHGGPIATVARGARRARESAVSGLPLALLYLGIGMLLAVVLLPHFGVVLGSLAHDWTGRLLPQWTTENYSRLLTGQDQMSAMAAGSIKTSLLCATLSMTIDLVVGFGLAYALVRGKIIGAGLLDTLAMMPLALPGLILAFGLLMTYRGTLDPLHDAIPLLVASYAVRRLPYALRAVSSGLQQMSVGLEEASLNLGASPLRTVMLVTRPLVTANLIAAGLLTFAFAVLEVSDSLILSSDAHTAPIAKVIYLLSTEASGGAFLACAMGVIGMALLTVTFLLANRLLGRQLGAMFRM